MIPAALLAGGVVVWGAGGHGKVVASLIRLAGHTLAGFVDAAVDKLGSVAEPGGATVVATEAQLREFLALANGDARSLSCTIVPAFGDNMARLAAVKFLDQFTAPPLIHPTAACDPSASVAPGSVVFAAAVINAAATIGRGVIINSGAIVEHDVQLCDGVHISPGAVLAGGVTVGEAAWIGAGAVVIPGIRIGRRAVVGAGTVVIRDIPDGITVVGNPARSIDPREP